ncbi:MAG: hypothetical protein RBU27_03880 [Bacteroidota bacterium]|jgi:hypothetical protein|nr:hypothetical protein [Bacteroidota bacterium]
MKRPLLFLVLLATGATAVTAQERDELQVFGSMQSVFMHQESQLKIRLAETGDILRQRESRSSFAVQQLDLFLSKEIDESFSAFIDLEFQANYSSEKHWGSLSLQEAWLNYHYDEGLNIKAGLLFPAFNHLNEIKNRLALLPYVFRPMVYERLLSTHFFNEDFIPEHAYLQVSGVHASGGVFFDYAAFAGNAEASYLSSTNPDGSIQSDINRDFEFLSGFDPSSLKLKLFGGRLGIRTRDEQWKAGVSFTHDYNNLRDTLAFGPYVLPPEARALLGDDAERIRLGADLSFRYGDFLFEGELIKVIYDYEPAEELKLHAEQGFAYGLLGYDILPSLTLYGSLQWGDYYFGVAADYFVYTTGAAWRFNEAITAKAQFIVYDELHENVVLTPGYLHADSHRVTLTFGFLGLSILL